MDWGSALKGGSSSSQFDWGSILKNDKAGKEPEYWAKARKNNFDFGVFDREEEAKRKKKIQDVVGTGGDLLTRVGPKPPVLPGVGVATAADSKVFKDNKDPNQFGVGRNNNNSQQKNPLDELTGTIGSLADMFFHNTIDTVKQTAKVIKNDKDADPTLRKALREGNFGAFTQSVFGRGAGIASEVAPIAKGASATYKGMKAAEVAASLAKSAAANGTLNTAADVAAGRKVDAASIAGNIGLAGAAEGGGIFLGKIVKAFSSSKGDKLVSNLIDNTSSKSVMRVLDGQGLDFPDSKQVAKQIAGTKNRDEVIGILKNAADRADGPRSIGQDFNIDSTPTIKSSQLRSYEATDPARVKEIEAQIKAGERPGIKVNSDSSGKIGVEDGKHTAQAYKNLGIEDIPYEVAGAPNVASTIKEARIGPNVAEGEKAIKSMVDEAADALTSFKKETGGVSLIPGENGAKVRASSNPKWYQDFYTENKRAPNKSEVRAIAQDMLERGDKQLEGMGIDTGLYKATKEMMTEAPAPVAPKAAAAPKVAVPSPEDAVAGINSGGIKGKIREIFNPVKNLDEKTQQTFKTNAGARGVASQKKAFVTSEIRKLAKEDGVKLDMDLVHQIENGTAPKSAFTDGFREIADTARKEANDAGLDIGYRENFIPHIWKQSEEAVDRIAKASGMKARAEGERIIPTYEEGLALGLKAKYDDPALMMGDYVKNIENARANVALVTDLRDQGLIKGGKPPAGWKPVEAQGFPKAPNGAPMHAPKEVADVLNNIYTKNNGMGDRLVGKLAKFNSKWQDIALAGGIPHTPANFFTFSQMVKEGALGAGEIVTGRPIQGAKTIMSPMASFVRSFSSKATDKFKMQNKDFLESLAKNGVSIDFSDGSAGKWDKMFNDPTFGKFMPNLQLSTAKNTFNFLEKKVGKDAAMKETAQIMKRLYGLTDQMATGRAPFVQDLIGTVGFAPKYRESILNVLGNTAMSLNPKTYGDVSYSLNRRLAAGMGVTFLAYDQLNKQLTGHGMFENPDGKELQLAIPYGEKDDKGVQKVIYIPFMPSFMTIPRAAVGAAQSLAKGDLGGVVAEGGKMLSMPIQVASQILSNRDYFGRPIVNNEEQMKNSMGSSKPVEEDTPLAKFGKQAMYIAGQSSPALVRAGIDKFVNGKSDMEVLAQAGEAPVRFGEFSNRSNEKSASSPGEVTTDFYKSYNPASIKKDQASQKVTQLVKSGDNNQAKRVAEEWNASIDSRFDKLREKYGDIKGYSDWDDRIDSLKISVTDKGFAARKKSK